ncbi:MAG: 5'/3'-nucleotidase SurE [Pirellulaceae bacterium]
MHILLTNDDGIDAPGLAALRNVVERMWSVSGPEKKFSVTVVAPDRERSECGHSARTGRPFNVERHEEAVWSVDGTPVDCIRLAFEQLAPKTQLVLAGINQGANLGTDVLVSGTFAAAREAFLRHVPAVAVSHYRRPDVPKDWDHVGSWLAALIEEAVRSAKEKPFLWNINLPAVPPERIPDVVDCEIDQSPLRVVASSQKDGRVLLSTDYHSRPRQENSDVDRCFRGAITRTKIDSINRLAPLR